METILRMMKVGVVWVVLVGVAMAALYEAVLRMSPLDRAAGPIVLPAGPPRQPTLGPPIPLQGRLARLGEGQVLAPEDVAVGPDGHLYVGCEDGWIKRIEPSSGRVHNWTHIPGGRPLGLAFGLHGELIVCDGYKGLLNVTNDGIKLLSKEVNGRKFGVVDDVTIGLDGTLYFTDASYKYPFGVHQRALLEGQPHGRLMKYDPTTKETTLLMENLYFANGVAVSNDNTFVVVCETLMARCQKYWLKGDKQGTTEIFIDNLPAFPDNVHSDGTGKFWIALISSRSFLMDMRLRHPFIRHLESVLGLEKYLRLLNNRALIVLVDEKGTLLASFVDPSGASIRFVTSAFVNGKDMFLGSLAENFVGHFNLRE